MTCILMISYPQDTFQLLLYPPDCLLRVHYRVDQAIRFSVANFAMKNGFFLNHKYLEPDMETV